MGALQRRPLLVPTAELDSTPADEAVARRLLASPDGRSSRLGLDLLTAMSSPAIAIELHGLAGDPRPDIRMSALARLAASGDESARGRLAEEVRAGAGSTDGAVRLRAASALEVLDSADRAAAAALLEDEDVAVRAAALDSVQAADLFALAPTLAALGDARSAGPAAGAIGRLGDAVLPSMADMLDGAGSPAPLLVMRLVRAATTRSVARDQVLYRHVGHRDRELGLAVLERLVAPEPAPDESAAVLDGLLHEDVRHAGRILAAIAAIDASADDRHETDGPLLRALRDELDLVSQRVRSGRLARHGSARLGPAMVELAAGGSSGALAMEALAVLLSPAESRQVVPLLHPDLTITERLDQLPALAGGAALDIVGWLQDLVADADGQWRSAWLRACAIHAASARGVLERVDLVAARALGDPVIDEVLSSANADV